MAASPSAEKSASSSVGSTARRPRVSRTREGLRHGTRPRSARTPIASGGEPEGLDELGWQRTSRARPTPGPLRGPCARQPEFRAGPPSAAQRAVSDERKLALAASPERAREAEDVLPLRESSEAEECGATRAPADLGAGGGRVPWREALEIHPAVDDLGLAPPRRARLPRAARGASPTPRRRLRPGERALPARGGPDPRSLRVRHVLAVSGDDERRA